MLHIRRLRSRTCYPCRVKQLDADRERINLRARLRKYGLTETEYREIVERQQGRCAICGEVAFLHIDHCHKNGHVRDALCGHCNRALGFFKEDPVIIAKALAYLRRHRVVSTAAV